MEDLGSLWGTFWAKAIRRWCNYNTCKYYCNLFYPLSTAGWFPGKQSLKWNLACRVFIEMCPWEQHLWKGWWEVEFAWHREKSSTRPTTASAAHREFWNALSVQSHSTLCNPPTVAQQPLCIVPRWIRSGPLLLDWLVTQRGSCQEKVWPWVGQLSASKAISAGADSWSL